MKRTIRSATRASLLAQPRGFAFDDLTELWREIGEAGHVRRDDEIGPLLRSELLEFGGRDDMRLIAHAASVRDDRRVAQSRGGADDRSGVTVAAAERVLSVWRAFGRKRRAVADASQSTFGRDAGLRVEGAPAPSGPIRFARG